MSKLGAAPRRAGNQPWLRRRFEAMRAPPPRIDAPARVRRNARFTPVTANVPTVPRGVTFPATTVPTRLVPLVAPVVLAPVVDPEVLA